MNIEKQLQHFFRVFFADSSQLSDVCLPTVQLHWRGEVLISGLTSLIEFGHLQHQIFPDLTFTIHDMVINKDELKAAVRLTQKATLAQPWETATQIGMQFEVGEMMFFHFEQGLISDIWPIPDMDDKKAQLTHT